MKKQRVNGLLRQWARGISFTIAMGRRQVFTLVSLSLSQDRKRGAQFIGDRHRHMCSFVTSMNCLVDRGLVIAHVWNDETLRKRADKRLTRDLWQLTRAGELVIELLKEAGIYEDVKTELEAAERPRLRIA